MKYVSSIVVIRTSRVVKEGEQLKKELVGTRYVEQILIPEDGLRLFEGDQFPVGMETNSKDY